MAEKAVAWIGDRAGWGQNEEEVDLGSPLQIPPETPSTPAFQGGSLLGQEGEEVVRYGRVAHAKES